MGSSLVVQLTRSRSTFPAILGGFSPAIPEFNESIEVFVVVVNEPYQPQRPANKSKTINLSAIRRVSSASQSDQQKKPTSPCLIDLEDSPRLPPDLRPEGWVPDDVKAILSPEDGLTIIIDGPLLAIKLPQRHGTIWHRILLRIWFLEFYGQHLAF